MKNVNFLMNHARAIVLYFITIRHRVTLLPTHFTAYALYCLRAFLLRWEPISKRAELTVERRKTALAWNTAQMDAHVTDLIVVQQQQRVRLLLLRNLGSTKIQRDPFNQ